MITHKSANRFLAMILSLLLVFTLMTVLPGSGRKAYADGSVDTWDGTADTSWYDAGNPKTSYEITTAEQLAGLAKIENETNNNFKGVTFTLKNDLDLAGHPWTPIGTDDYYSYFAGTFDGGYHVIRNLTNENLA